MFQKVEMNKYGFYNLRNIPSKQELGEFYSLRYYQQEDTISYSSNYTQRELEYINNELHKKNIILQKLLINDNRKSMLDIGGGEGWALKYFQEIGWDVLGLDYSRYGCERHNPDMLGKMIFGDMEESLYNLKNENMEFNFILLDNVLEHVIDPFKIIKMSNELLSREGVLVVEVPNDFSIVQNNLFNKGYIDYPFWIAEPDHISYFNLEGLINLCKEAGLTDELIIGDFPIDFFLFNEHSNYVVDKKRGKQSHFARMVIEQMLLEISEEKAIQLYKIMASMGLGRQIIGFFKKDKC